MGAPSVITVSSSGVELELELRAAPTSDAAERSRSLWEAERLVFELASADERTRRSLYEVYERLTARSLPRSPRAHFDAGPYRVEALVDALLGAVRGGTLVVRRRERRRVVMHVEQPEAVVPDAPQTETTDWIAVSLKDDKGNPVVGERCAIGAPDGSAGGGPLRDGKVRWDGIPTGTCTIDFPDIESSEWQPGVQPSGSGQTVVIQQGDHVAKLAAKAGFRSYKTVWNHPKNASLKSLRTNPNALLPGDELFVPDKQDLAATRSTGASHPFTLSRAGLRLRVKFLDACQQPLASTPCQVDAGSVSDTTSTDGDAKIDEPIDALSEDADLEVNKLDFSGQVGDLNPFDTPSGVAGRLRNFGYDVSGDDEADYDETLAWGIEEFQCDQGLKVTGAIDDVKPKLKSAHGC